MILMMIMLSDYVSLGERGECIASMWKGERKETLKIISK